MKKLRFFDSLKFVVAVVACIFILNVAHADTSINSVIAYGKTEQSGTPTPTNPVPIMTNNGVLKLGKNLFNENTVTRNYFYNDSGVYTQNNNTFTSDKIPMRAGTPVTFSRERAIIGVYLRIHAFDSNNNWISMVAKSDTATSLSTTGTTPNNTAYIRVCGAKAGSGDEIDQNIQVEKGSTVTAYQPYGTVIADGMVETIRDSAGHTATAQMLLGIDDTYRDEQNITTGAITRKVGVKVFDGTGTWASSSTFGAAVYLQSAASNEFSPAAAKEKIISNYFVGEGVASRSTTHPENTCFFNSTGHFYFRTSKTPAEFKQWLADQYTAGTPVIVVYPLETETPEPAVAPQSLTTAPVRQTAGSILGMPIEVVLGDGTREWVRDMITIATTKYNEEQFEPVKTDLSAAMNAVDDVVTRTMTQAQAIDQIATSKQTRPDESCPPFKKCLLVEDEDGTPHWYEIYDPINDFLNPILAAALSGNQGAPIMTTHDCTGTGGEPASGKCYDDFNGFWHGNSTFLRKYVSASRTAATRPFGPTTLPRCADNATRTTLPADAGICYNTGGMFRELTEGSDDDAGEWAIVYNGNEGGASLGITPGVVYGVAKCTSVGKRGVEGSYTYWPKATLAASNGGTTLSSLISEYPNSNVETVFNTLPNPVGTDDNPEYPRENFQNCWCKMTAIGVPGAGDTPDQRYANGTIMSVSGDWVSANSTGSLPCAINCANYCVTYIQAYRTFRQKVLTVK